MKVESVNNIVYQSPEDATTSKQTHVAAFKTNTIKQNVTSQNSIAFKGNFKKRFLLMFRDLSDYMKEPSEMTNALIAFIGTGAIAPFAIMLSPKKKGTKEEHINMQGTIAKGKKIKLNNINAVKKRKILQ